MIIESNGANEMKSMTIISGVIRAVALGAALVALGANANAQQSKPSAASIETAREIIAIKGAANMFDALIPGVIEQGKTMFETQNPALSKDLGEVAAKMRADLAPRLKEVTDEIATLYASRFTEKEIKDILAFYNSPVGKKMISEEPKALEASMSFAQDWAIKFSDEVLGKMRAEMKKKGHNL